MPPENKSDRFTKIYLLLWGICLVIGLTALIFYKSGFRLGNNFAPIKVGRVELSSNESGLQIFLDNREKKVSVSETTLTLGKITPGLHSLVVSKNGFWPWAKALTVHPNTARRVYVFLFPMDGVTPTKIPVGTTEYASASKLLRSPAPEAYAFASAPIPDESLVKWLKENVPDFIRSGDKSTALYIKDGTIYLAWISESEPPPHYFCEENPCKLTIPVIVSVQPIKSASFYKDRRDVVLFASGTTIYGIEADHEGTQNFQPLYKGDDPYFAMASSTLYIKDGNSILKSSL